jgi:tRNA-Thr(GGU) m(6)t(6)A37 methyltransferase TsaA
VQFEISAIGIVQASRTTSEDDFWGRKESTIVLTERFNADALAGLDDFSHVEVLYLFHEVDASRIVTGTRHPRGNPAWPAVGIFSQRGKNRPNRIGSTICRIIRIQGSRLVVSELDAIDGTPVIDIKPVMKEFLPRQEVRQPSWSTDLMRQYWLPET